MIVVAFAVCPAVHYLIINNDIVTVCLNLAANLLREETRELSGGR